MGTFREDAGPAVSIAIGHDDEQTEADAIATRHRGAARDTGVRYRDIAILVRGTDALPEDPRRAGGLGDPGAARRADRPVRAARGGRLRRDVRVAGRHRLGAGTFHQAREDRPRRPPRRLPTSVFDLGDADVQALRDHLIAWQAKTTQDPPDWDPSLVGDFYGLTELLDIASGTSPTRCSATGSARSRASPTCSPTTSPSPAARGSDPENPSEQVGGAIGDEWFYKQLRAAPRQLRDGNYDDFDGEEDLLADGVALGTVHGAKGLEWPVVFLPSLTEGRGSRRAEPDRQRDWLLPRDLFDAARYEGSRR